MDLREEGKFLVVVFFLLNRLMHRHWYQHHGYFRPHYCLLHLGFLFSSYYYYLNHRKIEHPTFHLIHRKFVWLPKDDKQ